METSDGLVPEQRLIVRRYALDGTVESAVIERRRIVRATSFDSAAHTRVRPIKLS
jgi:hypothetical protein